MAQEIALSAQEREPKTSRGVLRQRREKGEIPAVLYGADKESFALWISRKELEQALHKAHSANILIHLNLESLKGVSKKETVLLKAVQKHILNGSAIHVDFLRVKLTQKVDVEVPIRVKGEATGVKYHGGILEHLLRELKVRTLPTAIPEAVEVDVTNLEIGQSLLVKDLSLPKDVELLTDASHVVLNVVAPAKEEVAAPVAEAATPGAAQQPEVIAKGKKEAAEEGAEAPKVPGAKAETPAAKK